MQTDSLRHKSALWNWFDATRRIADTITMGLNMLGTSLIMMMVLLINSDVIGRAVFGAPISGVPEIVTLSIVAIVFLQIAQTVVSGRLTRSDALLSFLALRWPRIHRTLESIFNLMAAGLLAVLMSASLPLFEKSWSKGTFIGSIGNFTAPVWPVKLIIVIGCLVLVAQFVLSAVKVWRPADPEALPGDPS